MEAEAMEEEREEGEEEENSESTSNQMTVTGLPQLPIHLVHISETTDRKTLWTLRMLSGRRQPWGGGSFRTAEHTQPFREPRAQALGTELSVTLP